MYGTNSCRHRVCYVCTVPVGSVLLNRERTSLQRWKYILERGVVLGLMPMAALLLDQTRTSRNNIICSVNTFSLILPSTASIDPVYLQDLPVTIIIVHRRRSTHYLHQPMYCETLSCACEVLKKPIARECPSQPNYHRRQVNPSLCHIIHYCSIQS